MGGYCPGWVCLPAHATGAPFWGKRVAIVAASDSVRRDCVEKEQKIKSVPINLEMLGAKETRPADLPLYMEWPVSDPERGAVRDDDGLPSALDELKCYGNAVDPRQFYPFFKAIAEIENRRD